MTNPFRDIEKEKTIIEHSKIINDYKNLGIINRDEAIKKYLDFNSNHPDYYLNLNLVTTISNTKIKITEADNDTLIANLKAQILWLQGN